MTLALATSVSGAPQLIADPLTGRPIAFEDPDLADTVAFVIAQHGFGSAAAVEIADDAEVTIVTSDEEALTIARLLTADLRLKRRLVARAASQN